MKKRRSPAWRASDRRSLATDAKRPSAGDRALRRRLDGVLRFRISAALAFSVLIAMPAVSERPQEVDRQTAEHPLQLAGKPLTVALSELAARGLKLVFTTELVGPDLVVESEPRTTSLRDILDEILRPHDLAVEPGPGGTLVVVRRRPAGARRTIRGLIRSQADATPLPGARVRVLGSREETVTDSKGTFRVTVPPAPYALEIRRFGFTTRRLEQVGSGSDRDTLVIDLDTGLVFAEELTITPSRMSLLRDTPVAPLSLGREQILALPHLADDFYRALSLMPGVTSNDVTAQFHVRGGRRDETRILLDGQELYDAYHLQDFDSALSLVSSSTLGSADLTTGGFAAEHGDRMSAVLDMRTIRPAGKPRGHVGASVLAVSAGGAGIFRDGRGVWLVEARRGTIDLVNQLLGQEDPDYWDGYGKLDYQLDERNGLSGHLLLSGDALSFSQIDGSDSKRTTTDYGNGYAWLTHDLLVGDRLLVESAVSLTQVDRDRYGEELEEDVRFTVADVRDSDIGALRQSWSLQAARHLLRGGFELRRFDTSYDYRADFTFDNPLASIRQLPGGEPTLFRQRFEERHDAVFLADLVPLSDRLSLDAGLRWDDYSQTRERLWSPRLNLAVRTGTSSTVRLAWGRFAQSQRPYELEVQDGESAFHPVERSNHALVGFERSFRRDNGYLALRAEVYRRRVENPRPRYENLFEALNTFPEIEPDRVRIAADEAVIDGFELLLKREPGRRVAWWINYTYGEARDEIDGRRVWRSFDQRHTLNVDLDLDLGRSWRLNLAWRFHSGWPTTALTTEARIDENGEVVFEPLLGPLYGRRLASYHRLDLRARRQWRRGETVLGFFVDIQNLYDHRNLAGFDIQIDEETGTVGFHREYWPGILPSAGMTLEF